MRKIRVLVVDDSVVVRKLICDALATAPDCEVVGIAANGKIAVQKIPQLNPDIVTLDVEMPEMDGLETLAAIRKSHRSLPVIMFSSLTERSAQSTLTALSLGANDYVAKPSAKNLRDGLSQVQADLIPKIRQFVEKVSAPTESRSMPRSTLNVSTPRATTAQVGADIVAIGASTGGPNALTEVIRQLPTALTAPVLITQHMPPVFTRTFAERLNAVSGLSVAEAAGGEIVTPGCVWVAPGGYHLELASDGAVIRTVLSQTPPENSCRPAVDVMFRSVVRLYGARTLAVILTGMGQDGMRGCELVRGAGGQVIAQDEASSVVWGMPGFVAKRGLAHAVVPLSAVHEEILRRVNNRLPQNIRTTRTPGAAT